MRHCKSRFPENDAKATRLLRSAIIVMCITLCMFHENRSINA